MLTLPKCFLSWRRYHAREATAHRVATSARAPKLRGHRSPLAQLLGSISHPVNYPRCVIAYIHRTVRTEHNPRRPPTPSPSLILPSGNEVLRSAHRLPFVVELYAYDFVARRNAAIP